MRPTRAKSCRATTSPRTAFVSPRMCCPARPDIKTSPSNVVPPCFSLKPQERQPRSIDPHDWKASQTKARKRVDGNIRNELGWKHASCSTTRSQVLETNAMTVKVSRLPNHPMQRQVKITYTDRIDENGVKVHDEIEFQQFADDMKRLRCSKGTVEVIEASNFKVPPLSFTDRVPRTTPSTLLSTHPFVCPFLFL